MTTALPSPTIEQVPIDHLRPDSTNPRRIGEDELDTRPSESIADVQSAAARAARHHADRPVVRRSAAGQRRGCTRERTGRGARAAARVLGATQSLSTTTRPCGLT